MPIEQCTAACLVLPFVETPYDPYAAYGDRVPARSYRLDRHQLRNDFLAVIQMRPQMEQEKRDRMAGICVKRI